jgi:uncharacterized membrane protein
MKRSERYHYKAKRQFLKACFCGLITIISGAFGFVTYLSQSPWMLFCLFAGLTAGLVALTALIETKRLFFLGLNETLFEDVTSR